MRERLRLIRERAAERGEDEPLHRGVYLLPNLLTTCGLFLGFFSIIKTIEGSYEVAAISILVAQVCDGLDGRIARLTKSTSRFGIEYDSLSDLIAFGVAPGILVYKWALEPWGTWGWLAASLYVACGALRLARFNVQVDTAKSKGFVGLPIPAAADTVASTVLLYYFLGGEGATHKHIILLVVIYALAALMVSNVSYESFKGVHFNPRQPLWILVALIVGMGFVIAQPQIFLFTAFLLYALSGPVAWLLGYRKRRRARVEATVETRRDLRRIG
jgi:CDP-diacylglycerol--serine O-phosphatidyltransferase